MREKWRQRHFNHSGTKTEERTNIINSHCYFAMTAPLEPANQNAPPRELSNNKYFRAINNKHGLRQDMEAMCKFVRETLFYAMIHDTNGSGTNANNDIMGENGKACQVFIHVFSKDKDKISNVELAESNQEEKSQYLKFLWKEGLRAKAKYNIRKSLSNEKSAVYAGISESFKSKWVHPSATMH